MAVLLGPYDDNPQPREHSGIVLYYDSTWSAEIRAIVLDLEHLSRTKEIVLKKVVDEAFEVPASVVELAERKHLENVYSKPLLYGEQIEWNDDEVGADKVIRSCKKAYSTFETRVINNDGQILVEGLINPRAPESFYTAYFDYIQLPRKAQLQASPNVYIKAWISCNIYWEDDGEPKLDIEFAGFDKICSFGRQMDVSAAPWNRENSKFVAGASIVDGSDDESLDDFIQAPAHTVEETDAGPFNYNAYLTGDRTFLIIEQPHGQHKCIMPLKLETINWRIGHKYSITCYWNKFEAAYIVYDALPSPGEDVMPTDAATGFLKCVATVHPTFRGVFETVAFGIVDDPKCIFAYLHLTKFRHKRIAVSLVDDHPSRHGQLRFSVYGFGDKFKESKFHEQLENNPPHVSNVYGVVVERGVVSSEHVPNIFLFGSKDKPPGLGTHIIFDALYDSQTKRFNITSWQMDPAISPLFVLKKHLSKEINPKRVKQTLYLVNASLVYINDHNEMLHCQEFGLLDDPQNLVPIEPNKHYELWVKATLGSDDYQYRPRTYYHVVAVGKYAFLDKHGKSSMLNEIEQMQIELQEQLIERAKTTSQNDTEVSGYEPSTEEFSEKDDVVQNEADIPEDTAKNKEETSQETFVLSNKDASPASSESVHRYSPFHGDRYFGFKIHESALAYKQIFDEHGNVIRAPPSLSISLDEFGQNGDIFENVRPFGADDNGSIIGSAGDQRSIFSSSDEFNQSMMTENGGIDPSRHMLFHPVESSHHPVPAYSGPLLLAQVNEHGGKWDVVETLSRLKHTVTHGRCSNGCAPGCPWLGALADLIVNHEDFYVELYRHHPKLHKVIVQAFSNFSQSNPL